MKVVSCEIKKFVLLLCCDCGVWEKFELFMRNLNLFFWILCFIFFKLSYREFYCELGNYQFEISFFVLFIRVFCSVWQGFFQGGERKSEDFGNEVVQCSCVVVDNWCVKYKGQGFDFLWRFRILFWFLFYIQFVLSVQ